MTNHLRRSPVSPNVAVMFPQVAFKATILVNLAILGYSMALGAMCNPPAKDWQSRKVQASHVLATFLCRRFVGLRSPSLFLGLLTSRPLPCNPRGVEGGDRSLHLLHPSISPSKPIPEFGDEYYLGRALSPRRRPFQPSYYDTTIICIIIIKGGEGGADKKRVVEV